MNNLRVHPNILSNLAAPILFWPLVVCWEKKFYARTRIGYKDSKIAKLQPCFLIGGYH